MEMIQTTFSAFEDKLTIEQKQILMEYCEEDGGRKLDKICKRLIYKKDVPLYLEDDLYSLAQWTFLESLETYDGTRDSKFSTYLINSIWKAFYDWTRDGMRGKRCNLKTDSKGRILRDEHEHPIIIQNISLDAKIEDDVEWSEKIASDFNVEDEVAKEMYLSSDDEEWHDEVKEYLNCLSPLQRKIIYMLSHGYVQRDICKELHITDNHYNNSLKRIMADERIKPLKVLVERERR